MSFPSRFTIKASWFSVEKQTRNIFVRQGGKKLRLISMKLQVPSLQSEVWLKPRRVSGVLLFSVSSCNLNNINTIWYYRGTNFTWHLEVTANTWKYLKIERGLFVSRWGIKASSSCSTTSRDQRGHAPHECTIHSNLPIYAYTQSRTNVCR